MKRSRLMRTLFQHGPGDVDRCWARHGTATADDYVIDAAHSGVTFKISHLGLSWIHGRFDDFAGNFTIDSSDPAKSSFTLNIKPESVDTNNSGRDEHLKSPDFFNVKQFPALSFTSTAVKPIEGGYEVTGDLTMHGETKPVTFSLKGGKNGRIPAREFSEPAIPRELVLKRIRFRRGQADARPGRRGLCRDQL